MTEARVSLKRVKCYYLSRDLRRVRVGREHQREKRGVPGRKGFQQGWEIAR